MFSPSKRTMLLPLTAVALTAAAQPAKPLNVLFLIVDDLRPELGCYGCTDVKTPHIDDLARHATVFSNAYCNVPVSGASRASLLTGVCPDFRSGRFVDAETYAERDLPGVLTLPQAFKQAGYRTLSLGKVFHHYQDRTDSWSEAPWIVSPASGDWAVYNKWNVWKLPLTESELNPKNHRGPYCEAADLPDSCYEDNQIAQKAVATLAALKAQDKPFFLAVGFRKPHLPFIAPKRYWDLYQRDSIAIADNRYRPANLPRQVASSREIYQYTRTDNTSTDAFHREARHAYYACVSFIDAQIGLVLDQLERSGLADSTIVVLLGDHGWHLGEHDFWGKHTLMQQATHAPLLVAMPKGKAANTSSIVEFVDLYPTLCDACGIAKPAHLQGRSFLNVLQSPKKRHRTGAFVQWGAGANLVTERYSYAEWYDKQQQVTAQMLFDHRTDPAENRNVARDAGYASTVRRMQAEIARRRSALTLDASAAESARIDLYLCIGQSNMAGRGRLSDGSRDSLRGAYLWTDRGCFEPAAHPMNRYSTIRKPLPMQGVGPSYAFAARMTAATQRPVGLVVNARGGSSIKSWKKGCKDGYYEQALQRLRQAMSQGVLKAILWHQGESDVAMGEAYLPLLQELIANFRSDLNMPEMPFIVGEIAEWGPAPADAERNRAFNGVLRRLPKLTPHTACISSKGTTPLINASDPHFDAKSQILLGERYAEALLKMQQKKR